ncbi:MAG: MGMT family protein [Marinobacter sp.]|nr:MGMT family protein [Marinobacter sp.]
MVPSDSDPSNLPREQMIWQVVIAIPAGRVANYGQIAALAGLGRQARFVGRALGRLPDGSSVPWFRVVRSTGQLAFPRDSDGFIRQRDLLAKEGVPVVDGRVSMKHYRWEP